MAFRFASFAPVVACVVGATAYTAYKEFSPTRVASSVMRAAGVDISPADRDLTAKLQPFIACMNRVDASLAAHVVRYRRHIADLLTPPKPGTLAFNTDPFRSFRIEVYEQNNQFSLECASGLDRVQTMAPADAVLDPVAKRYAETLRGLIPLLNEADTYYGQKDHADDKMAKGRLLDAKLTPLFAALAENSSIMRRAVAGHDAKLKDNRLAMIETREGKSLNWHTLNLLIEARKVVDDIEQANGAPDRIAAAEKRLQGAYDAGREVAQIAPATPPNVPKPLWTQIDSYAAGLLLAIKELRREPASGRGRSGIERIQSRYNDLVRHHNMVARF